MNQPDQACHRRQGEPGPVSLLAKPLDQPKAKRRPRDSRVEQEPRNASAEQGRECHAKGMVQGRSERNPLRAMRMVI
jgi:hypothetical protein